MKQALTCAALLCAALTASADDLIWQGDGVSVRFLAEPCQRASLVMILSQNSPAPAYQAEVTIGSRSLGACWAELDDRLVLVDEDGDGGYIAKAQLKISKSV
jgi:hypothetical protein